MLNNKIPPVLVLFVFALFMALIAFKTAIDYSSFITVLSLLSVSIGVIFGIAGVISFRQAKTTLNPQKIDNTSELVTSGIFKITRNPMYVGLTFLLIGWGFWLTSIYALIGVVGFVFYITYFQIKPEEKALLRLFPEQYKHYMSKVRRWL
ncbi:isoprenylcysteine carboxylmethyltransferase family protein [Pseudoalteromonas sp. MMG010]|uniref:methyltransferase family protein n=1 Tax=Pseudoalteromonas sp. MMG010 TaxID=2822685 RepID=UPI001B3A2A0D|nr:isoprenylcysteine carboxylmethyltransferase family protein [Pseudoalteromonas sp. MMG010]MBQ4833314.1 isoprenylcysteine carboxylmethyltransferase family protein [Pseudoalteromonas sp. MMG010]